MRGVKVATGVHAGALSREHRMDRAYRPAQLRHELRVAVDELVELIEADLETLTRVYEVEAAIELTLRDQYGLAELIQARAAELQPLFEMFVRRMRCYDDDSVSLDVETAVTCVNLAYKHLLLRLETEPSASRTIHMAWLGILELS